MRSYKYVWGALVIVGSIVAAAWAVSDRFVNRLEYTGSMVVIEKRLDRIEGKIDRLSEKP